MHTSTLLYECGKGIWQKGNERMPVQHVFVYFCKTECVCALQSESLNTAACDGADCLWVCVKATLASKRQTCRCMKFSTLRQKLPIMSTHCRQGTHMKAQGIHSHVCNFVYWNMFVKLFSLLEPGADLLHKLRFLTRKSKDKLNIIKPVFTLLISDTTKTQR